MEQVFAMLHNQWYQGFHTGLFAGIGVATAVFGAAVVVGLLVKVKAEIKKARPGRSKPDRANPHQQGLPGFPGDVKSNDW